MKPRMRLLELSIFSPNNVIIRGTKIMNNRGKDLKILIFKVIFQHQKLVESFPKKVSLKNTTSPRITRIQLAWFPLMQIWPMYIMQVGEFFVS